jgi:hypothetical protein
MKIKGPGDFSVPPSPEFKGDEKKVGKFEPEKLTKGPEETKAKKESAGVSNLEQGFQEVARAAKAEGLKGEALTAKVVDTVLTEMFGKDFLNRPEAAALRDTITPFVSQDEHLSAKINSLISRLGNKS